MADRLGAFGEKKSIMDKKAESCSNRTDGCAVFEALMCFPGAAETTTTMVIVGMTDIVPYVIDGRKMGAMKAFRSLLDRELEDAGNEMVDELLDADVVVSGYIAEYNASLVSVSLIATHVETGAVLWSGEMAVRVGWVRLDVESAAERAVGMLMRKIQRGLARARR